MQRATTPEASTADTGHFAGAGARGRRPADHTFQWLIDSAVAVVWMALFPELRRIRAYDG